MHELRLGRFGQTMERGFVEAWLKREGDPIAIGDVLCEVQTDKATVDVEATAAGRLVRIVAAARQELPVGGLLAIIADPGEALSAQDVERAIAEELAGAAGAVAGVEPPERSPTASAAHPRVRIMPRARALAERSGIDPGSLTGTGPGGAVTVADVESAATLKQDRPRVRERRPLDGWARAMADAMTRSAREVPQFFQQVTVMAAGLRRQRDEARRAQPPGAVPVSYSDVIVAACAKAVRQCPLANASFAGDEVVLYEDVDVGLAVSAPGGLVVPVIRRVQELDLGVLAARRAELVDRARVGRLAPEELAGATITVSNLGMWGVEQGAALIAPPQAAIVFAGAIVDRPVAVNGHLEVASCLQLSITFDHRVLDGALAAEFTAALRRHIEEG